MTLCIFADNHKSMNDEPKFYQKAIDESGIKEAISCAQAMALCNKYQFSRVPFRKYCDTHNVKFSNCSFGCFK